MQGPGSLAELVGQTIPGDQVALEVRREREHLTVHPLIQRREISFVTWMRGGAILWRGLRLTDLTPAVRRNLNVDAGATGVVVIDVLPGSQAERARVEIGDVVEGVEQNLVGDVRAFSESVTGKTEAVSIRLRAKNAVLIQP